MSSNGVMLQDYVPNAINNLTEDIWMAGGVIPAGKRVVIGKNRDGWQEVTFTMGPNQDIIGMALVPPAYIGIEPAPPRGFGLMPPSVVSRRARSQRRGIDQSAPLPQSLPGEALPGQYTAAEAARRARMEQALPPAQGRPVHRAPYQWGGLHASPEGAGQTMVAPANLRGYSAASQREIAIPSYRPMMPGRVASRYAMRGFGAGGASAFTVTAANALNQELITNSCAGCADMTSRLRQLTFAFKAAVMTDTGMPAQNLNMSNLLAMTAYGPATDTALKMVLGSAGTYANGPCTDDAGNCLGNLPTPVTPQAVQAVEQQLAKQIQTAIQQVAYIPQADIVHSLVQAFAALVNQFTTELAKLQIPVEAKPPAPPAAAPAKSMWPTFVIGGLIGTTILATGALIYTQARRA